MKVLIEAHEAALRMVSGATCRAAAHEAAIPLVEWAVTTFGGAKPLALYACCMVCTIQVAIVLVEAFFPILLPE